MSKADTANAHKLLCILRERAPKLYPRPVPWSNGQRLTDGQVLSTGQKQQLMQATAAQSQCTACAGADGSLRPVLDWVVDVQKRQYVLQGPMFLCGACCEAADLEIALALVAAGQWERASARLTRVSTVQGKDGGLDCGLEVLNMAYGVDVLLKRLGNFSEVDKERRPFTAKSDVLPPKPKAKAKAKGKTPKKSGKKAAQGTPKTPAAKKKATKASTTGKKAKKAAPVEAPVTPAATKKVKTSKTARKATKTAAGSSKKKSKKQKV